MACGAPFLANSFSAVLSPLRLLVAIGARPSFWDIYLLSRLFIAALLTFLFARRIGIGFAGSIIAAIIFTLSGHFILEVNMPDLDVQIWLPGLLLAAEELLQKPTYRAFIATALLVALIILSGMPESAFFVFLLAGSYFLVRLWIWPCARREGQSPRWKQLIRFGAAGITGLLISLPLVLPFLEYLRHSFNPRAPGVGSFYININTAASLIMPRFFGHVQQTWTGVSSFFMLPYIGAASLLHEEKDVLHADNVRECAGQLGDVRNAAGAVAHTRCLDDDVDGRRNLCADGLFTQLHFAQRVHRSGSLAEQHCGNTLAPRPEHLPRNQSPYA